ncbi:mucin-5AC-like isoform X2 [Pecten maximus]|uniref:mucin-5AC-like isoform X2 n=1 Tax=Pecten maximus TaxID=6579 RepID=UPI0014582134|nr:mucin-5AC-like isoform X2 [Pecten maximus]
MQSAALKCYDCHQVDNPNLCKTITQCPSRDHFCITTQSFDDDFKDTYKLGCALNSICAEHLQTVINRRDQILTEVIQLKGSCCTTDLCNINTLNISTTQPSSPIINTNMPTSAVPSVTSGPSTTSPTPAVPSLTSGPSKTSSTPVVPSVTSGPSTTSPTPAVPSVTSGYNVTSGTSGTQSTSVVPAVTFIRKLRSSVCKDVTTDICTRLGKSLPNMCSNDCIANEVCPRTCRKCISCYDCSHVPNPENCTQKTICERGEQCLSVETLSASFEHGYKLGCIGEKICSTFGHAAPGTFGKRQGYELFVRGGCCNQELCNQHAVQQTSPKQATSTMSTLLPSTALPTTITSTTSTSTGPTATSKPASSTQTAIPTTSQTTATTSTALPTTSKTTATTSTALPTTSKTTWSTKQQTKQTAAALVTTTLIPCKDYDSSGYCSQFVPIICTTTDPISKKFALSNCALSCNLCDEFQALVASGEITISP